MKTINLLNCFPAAKDGTRGPLPKQKQFLDAALDTSADGPKYLRYSGGIGSAKTTVGCITMIHMAALEPGDYLIGRQYAPELRATTYKTFMEVCPPELIAEVRVADMEIKLHNVKGSKSTIYFRGLEFPDKLRSMNLNAFYIDEGAQVSEGAFMLLQGRLRGRAYRKGFLTMNPGGHDWSWRWWIKQDFFKSEESKRQYLNIRAPSTENIHLPEGYVQSMLETWSEDRIKREIMGSDDVFAGQIYNEFDRSKHVVKSFRIPDDWEIRIGIDHGYRNQAAWVYGAMSPDNELYIFNEFYEKEWLIEEICKKGKDGRPSALAKIPLDASGTPRRVSLAKIDPSVRQTRGQTGKSDWDTYLEWLPHDFPLGLAANEVAPGIDRVKSYLKLDARGKPRVYVFDTCVNLLDEIAQYRWKEQTSSLAGRANLKEEPVKNKDHLVDSTRYLIMTCPEVTPKKVDPRDALREHSLERSLYDNLSEYKRPRVKDPFGD